MPGGTLGLKPGPFDCVKYWQVSRSICLWKPQMTGIFGCCCCCAVCWPCVADPEGCYEELAADVWLFGLSPFTDGYWVLPLGAMEELLGLWMKSCWLWLGCFVVLKVCVFWKVVCWPSEDWARLGVCFCVFDAFTETAEVGPVRFEFSELPIRCVVWCFYGDDSAIDCPLCWPAL